MRFDEVLGRLRAVKGDGAWLEVSKRAGVHYDTVARIARGAIPAPSVVIVERIADALTAIEAGKPAEPAKAEG